MGTVAEGRSRSCTTATPSRSASSLRARASTAWSGFLLIGIALGLSLPRRGDSQGALARLRARVAVGAEHRAPPARSSAVGAHWGEHVALAIVHPVSASCSSPWVWQAIVVAMLRLRDRTGGAGDARVRRGVAATRQPHRSGSLPCSCSRPSVVVATGNTALRYFDPVANAAGEPRLSSFLVNPAAPTGWRATFETEMTRRTLFGSSSRWFRYLYSPRPARPRRGHAAGDRRHRRRVGARRVQSYGITACYSFHGYTLHNIGSVELGNGINGQALSYSGRRAEAELVDRLVDLAGPHRRRHPLRARGPVVAEHQDRARSQGIGPSSWASPRPDHRRPAHAPRRRRARTVA